MTTAESASLRPAHVTRTTYNATSFGAGALFGIGLGISGMTNPQKVLGFLDVTGAWDPSLAFVMMAALAVHITLSRVIRRRGMPLFDRTFHFPTRKEIDAPLVVGAALFGVGWGLAGFCPGPALVSLASAKAPAIVFVASMTVGMMLQHATRRAPGNSASPSQPAS